MSLIHAKCIEFNEKRNICLAEQKGKKFILNNESGFQVRKVRVDSCIDQSQGEKRCDFLMDISAPKKIVFFIELKGGDLVRATKQILETIIFLQKEFEGFQIEARIVGNRDVPNIIQTVEYKKLTALVKRSGGEIKRGTNNIYKETI